LSFEGTLRGVTLYGQRDAGWPITANTNLLNAADTPTAAASITAPIAICGAAKSIPPKINTGSRNAIPERMLPSTYPGKFLACTPYVDSADSDNAKLFFWPLEIESYFHTVVPFIYTIGVMGTGQD
jgi:hypothetical protein